ncbi:MAG: excinuclease ABC subunit UvrC [Proteobacteria bacterium]|nr:excinuclease ABC subunit UvrC [Pseudomonadota bacterium]
MSEIYEEKLLKIVGLLPKSPGVYLMKNAEAQVIYVGKAADLRVRVRSYFSGLDERYQVRFLMKKVDDIEVVVTDTEKEALILEDILIKKYRPRYNINLKDDKTYLSLRIDMLKPFPRVEVVRKRNKDGALYFGPYASAQALRETLALLQRVFQIRTCNDSYFKNRVRPCLSYQIKRCPGPCCGLIDSSAYGDSMREVILFLEGKNKTLVKRFKKRMIDASANLEFEEAARLRDCIGNIDKTLEKQKVYASHITDSDVVGICRKDKVLALYLLFVRNGKVTGGKPFVFRSQVMPDDEILSAFIRRYYAEGRYIPPELLIPLDLPDSLVLSEWLGELKEKKVSLAHPKRGEKVKLISLAKMNAENALSAEVLEEDKGAKLLESVQRMLNLKKRPARMECFDISNTQGALSVASMVVFIDGVSDKSLYRRYKIKTVKGADDFASMYEVLSRRIKQGMQEGDLPDLIVVDGGRGQLGMAEKALLDMEAAPIVDLVALAKEKVVGSEKKEERVYLLGRKNPLKLKQEKDVMYLFQRIRDEAHRFAITYHRKLRSKAMVSSPLDGVPGVGPARKKALLDRFGSLNKISSAPISSILEIKGVDRALADLIKKSLSSG